METQYTDLNRYKTRKVVSDNRVYKKLYTPLVNKYLNF